MKPNRSFHFCSPAGAFLARFLGWVFTGARALRSDGLNQRRAVAPPAATGRVGSLPDGKTALLRPKAEAREFWAVS